MNADRRGAKESTAEEAERLIGLYRKLKETAPAEYIAEEQGKLVTFGIVPDRPETGYGYVKAKTQGDAAVPVISFVEKPDLARARRFVRSGKYLWNAGMFVWRADRFLEHRAAYWFLSLAWEERL